MATEVAMVEVAAGTAGEAETVAERVAEERVEVTEAAATEVEATAEAERVVAKEAAATVEEATVEERVAVMGAETGAATAEGGSVAMAEEGLEEDWAVEDSAEAKEVVGLVEVGSAEEMAVARGAVMEEWGSVVATVVEDWEVAMVEVATEAEMVAVVTEGTLEGTLEEGLAEEMAEGRGEAETEAATEEATVEEGVPMEARIETVTWQRSTLTHPLRGSLPVGCFLCSKGC